MRKGRDKIRYTLFRKVLLLGVFTGLVFSCAEGIRLFPFPPPDDFQGSENIGRKPGDPGRHSYAKGLENGGGRHISRAKPEASPHISASIARAALPAFRILSSLAVASPESGNFVPVSAIARRLPDKRGPPVFFFV